MLARERAFDLGENRGIERVPAGGLEAEDLEAVQRAAGVAGAGPYGYRVLTAAHPEEALALVRGDGCPHIDLLLSDVVLPGMTGRELGTLLAREIPNLRILYVSGDTDDAVVHHGVLDPGLAFLQKPFSPAALARKVRDVLGAPPPAMS